MYAVLHYVFWILFLVAKTCFVICVANMAISRNRSAVYWVFFAILFNALLVLLILYLAGHKDNPYKTDDNFSIRTKQIMAMGFGCMALLMFGISVFVILPDDWTQSKHQPNMEQRMLAPLPPPPPSKQ